MDGQGWVGWMLAVSSLQCFLIRVEDAGGHHVPVAVRFGGRPSAARVQRDDAVDRA
jgi:hypothetical protein